MASRQVTFFLGIDATDFVQQLEKAQKQMNKTAKSLQSVGQTMSTYVTAPILAAGGASIKAAMDFESAFAGVIKTVDATDSELSQLRTGIIDLSKRMPTAATEIAGVAEAAGQLGIQTGNIIAFTETMVKLGDTTNLTANEAATAFARIANVMQLPQTEFDKLGSAVVDLGNNFATTEAEIVAFATRIAGSGKIAGITAPQVFAISTALSSVGIEAEAGGTAVQKALLGINDAVTRGLPELETYARVSGMTANEFKKAWQEDAGRAFDAFVRGLGRSGAMATKVLEDIGLDNERARAAFLSLSGAGDLLTRAMDTATTAFGENAALTKEANQRYETFASQLAMTKNEVFALAVEVGNELLPIARELLTEVRSLSQWFTGLDKETQKNIIRMLGLAAAIGPVLYGFGSLVRFSAGLHKSLASTVKWIGRVTDSQKLQNKAFSLNPYLIVGAALVTLTARYVSLYNEAKRTRDLIEKPIDTTKGIDSQIDQTIAKMTALRNESEKMVLMTTSESGVEAFQKRKKALEEQLDATRRLYTNLVLQREEERKLEASSRALTDANNDLNTSIESNAETFGDSGEHIGTMTELMQKNQERINELTSQFGDLTQGQQQELLMLERVNQALQLEIALRRELATMRASGQETGVSQVDPGVPKLQQQMVDTQRYAESVAVLGNKLKQVTLDTNGLNTANQDGIATMSALEVASLNWTMTLSDGLANAVVQSAKLSDMLKNIGRQLLQRGLSSIIFAGLTGGVGGLFGASGLFSGSFGDIFGKLFSVNDALITSGGDVVKFHPDDNILAMKDFGALQPSMSGGGNIHVTFGQAKISGTDLYLTIENVKRTFR